MKKLKNLQNVSGGFKGNFHPSSQIDASNIILVDNSEKETNIKKDYKSVYDSNNQITTVSLF